MAPGRETVATAAGGFVSSGSGFMVSFGFRFIKQKSIAPRHSHPRMPLIRRLGYADINARIKTQIFIGLICEPCVERANPARILFGADTAEKFDVILQRTDDRMANADGIVKFSVVAASLIVTVAVESGLKTHVPIRNVKG